MMACREINMNEIRAVGGYHSHATNLAMPVTIFFNYAVL